MTYYFDDPARRGSRPHRSQRARRAGQRSARINAVEIPDGASTLLAIQSVVCADCLTSDDPPADLVALALDPSRRAN